MLMPHMHMPCPDLKHLLHSQAWGSMTATSLLRRLCSSYPATAACKRRSRVSCGAHSSLICTSLHLLHWCLQLRDRYVRSLSLSLLDMTQLMRVPASRPFTTILHLRLDADIATQQDLAILSKGMWALVEAAPRLRSAELYVCVEDKARCAAMGAANDCAGASLERHCVPPGCHRVSLQLGAHQVAPAADAVGPGRMHVMHSDLPSTSLALHSCLCSARDTANACLYMPCLLCNLPSLPFPSVVCNAAGGLRPRRVPCWPCRASPPSGNSP